MIPLPSMPSLSDLLTTLISGLGTGSIYALFVLGIVLVFQVSKQVNFAYGQTGMLGAFASWYLLDQVGVPIVLAIVIGLVASTAISAATEMVVVRHVSKVRPGFDLIVTLGMFLVLTAAAEQLFGAEAHPFLTELSDNVFTIGDVYINVSDLVATVVIAAVLAGTYLVLNRTGVGIALRASAEDPDTAKSFGINVPRLRTVVWAIGGLIAGVAAVVFGSRLFVDTNYMIPVLISGFVASMVGGLNRFWSPILVAIGLGVYESVVGLVFGASASVPAVFAVLIVVLTFAPAKWVADEVIRP